MILLYNCLLESYVLPILFLPREGRSLALSPRRNTESALRMMFQSTSDTGGFHPTILRGKRAFTGDFRKRGYRTQPKRLRIPNCISPQQLWRPLSVGGLSSPQCKDKEGCSPLAKDRRIAGCAWRGTIFLSHRPGVSIQPSLGLHHTTPRENRRKEKKEKLNLNPCY